MTPEIIIPLLAAAVQSGTPLLFATLGEMLTERSGILNLGVEGVMLFGALCAFMASQATGQPWLGVVAGGLGGACLAGLHGAACIVFQGNQVVSGLALTIFGTGLANFLGTPLAGETAPGFSPLPLPGLASIPGLGPVLFNQDPLVYCSYLVPVGLALLLRWTRWGLALRAAGENPQAARAAGLAVGRIRFSATAAGGFLAGLGGAYLPLAYSHLWASGMTAGRGWIAVALVIFSFWRPGRAVLGAYLFGGIMALQLRLQALGANIPSSLLLMLPYALTVLVLVLSSLFGRPAEAPAALGVNAEPEA